MMQLVFENLQQLSQSWQEKCLSSKFLDLLTGPKTDVMSDVTATKVSCSLQKFSINCQYYTHCIITNKHQTQPSALVSHIMAIDMSCMFISQNS